MKKIALVLAILMVFCVLVSCNKDVEEPTTTETTQAQPENVTIHIKKDLVDEVTFLTSISEFEGIKVTSDDTFHILTMSQGTYVTFLKSEAQEVYDNFDAIIATGSFVEDITYNENFRIIKVIVDREGFDAIGETTQRLQLMTIGAYAMRYQMFLDEGQKTSVIAIYSDTEEEAMLMNLPVEM